MLSFLRRRVYAKKCRLCQRFGLLFQELARKHERSRNQNNLPGLENHLLDTTPRFARIQYGLNRHLCKGLGIQSLPTVLIYSRGTLVEQFTCGPKQNWPELMNRILYLQNMSLEDLHREATHGKEAQSMEKNDISTPNS